MKNSGLRIRIERELREQFLEVCREQDRPAAQVIREFMREYIASHENHDDKRKQIKIP
jgi:predicted DNA-binding protein